jgi:hypothetical protein
MAPIDGPVRAQTGHLRLAPRSAVRDIAADQSAGYLASMSSVEKTATTVVRQFNDCISRRDLDALSDMLAENHVFIDSAGNMISGKRACAKAWEGFFTAFPDYCNEFDRVEEKDGFVAVSGRSVCSDSRLHGACSLESGRRSGSHGGMARS